MVGKHHGNGMDQSKGIRRKEKEKKKQSITLFVVGISQRSEQYLHWALGQIFWHQLWAQTLGSDSAWKINAFLKIDQNLIRPLTRVQTDTCDLKPPFRETLTSTVQSTSCDQHNNFTFWFTKKLFSFQIKSFLMSVLVLFGLWVSYVRVTVCSFFHICLFPFITEASCEPRKKKVLDESPGVYLFPFIETQRWAQIHKNLINFKSLFYCFLSGKVQQLS